MAETGKSDQHLERELAEAKARIAQLTERRQAEDALRASEDRFRYIIKYDPNAIAVLDRDMCYIFVSDRFLHDYKVTEEDVIGRCHYDVFPEMPQRWKDVHQRVLAGAVERAEEDSFVRPDGSVDYNRWECRPWYKVDGTIGGMIMYTEVITERKRAEQALREMHGRMKATLDALPDLLFVLDRDGRIHDHSAPHPELLHVPPEEFIGRKMSDVLPEPAAGIVAAAIADAIAHQGRHHGSVYPLETPKGTRWFEVSIAAQGDLQTPEGRLVMLARDTTERKLAEEQLKVLNETLEQRVAEQTADARWRASQLQRLAGELTQVEQRERQRMAQLLHDNLQQLLVAAKLSADSLRRRLTSPEQHRFVQRVAELLGESLATSRSLTAELSPSILYEGTMAQALRWLGRRSKEKHGLAVRVEADEQADPASQEVRVLLFQAVGELLLNIAKHAGVSEADITLSQSGDDQVRVVVADEGAGFDRTQKQNEHEGDAVGGFGLFSIRERLELMGGRMEIDSQPGKGTRVVLVAPCHLADKDNDGG